MINLKCFKLENFSMNRAQVEEEARKIYQQLLSNPDMKLTSRSHMSSTPTNLAIRKYVKHMRDEGKGPEEVYDVLTNKFLYSCVGAKAVVADIFCGLEGKY